MHQHSELTIQKPKDIILQKTKKIGLKTRKEISPTCLVLISSRICECKCCQPNQKTKRKLHRKVFERIKESKLAGTLFPAESTNMDAYDKEYHS